MTRHNNLFLKVLLKISKSLRTSQREYKILIFFFFTLGKSLKVTSLLKFQVAFGFTKPTFSGSFQSHWFFSSLFCNLYTQIHTRGPDIKPYQLRCSGLFFPVVKLSFLFLSLVPLVWCVEIFIDFFPLLWLRWSRICLQCGDLFFSPWVRKIPQRRVWQPTPVFLPGESPWTEEPSGATVHGVTKGQTLFGD